MVSIKDETFFKLILVSQKVYEDSHIKILKLKESVFQYFMQEEFNIF